MKQPAGMLMMDRDGTLIKHIHYLADPESVMLIEGVIPALLEIQMSGTLLAIITNQSIIGRGIATPQQVENVNQKLLQLFRDRGVEIAAIQICPHSPIEGCLCRKPKAVMALSLLEEFNLEPNQALMVGDQETDIECAKNANMKSILFGNEDNPESQRSFFCQDWASISNIVRMEICKTN
jgi:D-glycero-D-manno-heptose 1,7-bisphosphate phosphatase